MNTAIGKTTPHFVFLGLLSLGMLLALFSPAAQAVSYDASTTIVVLIHGFDPDGYTRTGVFGDDETDGGVLDDVNLLASTLGQPTWQVTPTAPNHVGGATYYGDTAPSWYTAQDIAEDAAATSGVPRYALRMAKYIQHCWNRAPGVTAVNVVSGSFGTEVARYMIEHNLCNLCSDQKIARWNTIVGVTRGNWAATNVPDWFAELLGADSPDIDQMSYDWVTSNISASSTMNSVYFAPMIITHFLATADDDALTTAVAGNYANDGTNLCSDEFFAGYSSSSVLHATTDGTLQMPGISYQHCQHSDIVDETGMWAGVAAASQGNKRVTIKISRIKCLSTGDSWIQGNGEWVFGFSATSPRAATLYGVTAPISVINWGDGVLPLCSIAKNATKNPYTVLFDEIVPPGETQLSLTFEVEELDYFYNFYKIVENPWGDNKSMGSWSVSVSTTGDSTITLTNGNMQVDLTTTVKTVY